MERRKFITSMAGLTALGPLGSMLYNSSAEGHTINSPLFLQTIKNKNKVVEWNAHLFSPDITKYPFHPKATYQPDLSNYPKDPLAYYLNHLDENGIDKAIVVQPEPYGDDHSLILDSLKLSPDRLKGTSLFYPKDPTAPQKLEKLVKHYPGIVSTRFHAHRGKENYMDSFADSGVRALWKQAVDLDIIIELHIGPNYARNAGEAIKAFPGCKVLIDHLAEPHLGTGVEYADVLDLANFPNVFMKFSGLGHFAEDGPQFMSVRSFTSKVIKAFGTDRIVMGGVSPTTVDVHMADYPGKERAKVIGNNLIKLLKWK